MDKAFSADGLSADGKIVLEVEAGRAFVNFGFLKDIVQASLMHNVQYLALAVTGGYASIPWGPVQLSVSADATAKGAPHGREKDI